MKPRPIAFLPPVIWLVLIYMLLTLPGSDIPKVNFLDAIYFDKWVHTGLFAMLVFLFCWPFRKQYPMQHSLFISITVFAVVYGIALEYVQKYFASDRSFDISDMIADAFGSLLGYMAIRYVARKIAEKNKPL
ncbi:VanZ family protein [Ilyomonas limi]|uniref:VanZ family protein n=1 Tax=Ilyomonas limi TaxID=2575867 RepID=A0A4U3KYK2_9BACT|nr:VanZ family protein [Ilyomonas limi]TKK66959.1 VanZ family protein [Ilyomonas limi]